MRQRAAPMFMIDRLLQSTALSRKDSNLDYRIQSPASCQLDDERMSMDASTVWSMEPRRLPGKVNEGLELTYLRAGAEPPWERPKLDGVDVTDAPERWTPDQRVRRLAFEARVERYRQDGLL